MKVADEQFGQAALAAIDRLIELNTEFGLPVPGDACQRLRAKLAEGIYKVLVCGEAKAGKSSFVNSMLGADILPTDVDVATSQVFCVRAAPGQEPSYRVVFEDGSTRSVAQADLERYGSQVAIDRTGPADVPAQVRQIDVAVPGAFLPDGVQLLDTPGLGALYAAHAQITHRFLPQSDAVIMIIESGHPVLRAEIGLIDSVLSVTDRLFFIQTKIDQYDTAAWQEILRRNSQILTEHFADRLPGLRIWPFSSANLRAAADSLHAEALTLVSRYPDLADALAAFLDSVCAAPRAGEALAAFADHHQMAQAVLAARHRDLASQNEAAAAGQREELKKRWQDFNAAWGDQGGKRRSLEQGIRRITTLSRQAFRESLSGDAPLCREIETRIRTVATVAEANQLGTSLGETVVVAATTQWQRVCAEANRQYAQLFEPFIAEADTIVVPPTPTESPAPTTASRVPAGGQPGL